MNLLIKNIKELFQLVDPALKRRRGKEMSQVNSITDAYLKIENESITDFGVMCDLEEGNWLGKTIDATGKLVLPTYVDSHTHLIFAKTREEEFVDRINGLSYEEIAAKGGGILNSAKKLRETPEEKLYGDALLRLDEVIKLGTGAIEIKSGYGLTVQDELKMLRVIKKLKEESPIEIKSTFLGAHAIPKETTRELYIDSIIKDMLPKVAEENLAEYCDVFCETNYFTVMETERILETAANYDLKPKIHVNQFTAIGGIETAVKHNAVSVDHLEVMRDEDMETLKNSSTMPTLLPSCSFFLNIPYAPAREMINYGLPIALASDYNPGSTPSGNMNFVFSLACIKLRLKPEEALNALTINAAAALELQDTHGSITKGKLGNVIITKQLDSLAQIPYSFGSNLIDKVIIKGEEI